jgi:glycosyltransferase involved in cell wall biosynthesis
MPQPQVAISVWSRFHAFDLARELQGLGLLAALITTYPRFATSRYGVERRKIYSRPIGEVISRASRRVFPAGVSVGLDFFGKQVFERAARRALRSISADIFVGWSGSSLALLRDAHSRGMVTVLERGSSHIIEQSKTLLDEYARFGLAFDDTPAATIEQELAEYAEADYIAVPSRFVADSFLRQGTDSNKLLLIPYGADVTAFRPVPVPHQPFRIIQVGGVTIRKGFRYVADAFVEAAIPNSELWFVGGVSAEARQYFKTANIPGVVLQGHKPQGDLPSHYNQCDVACLGSVEEGMAMVLLQAAACGLPIVCTESTGGREIVGQNECGVMVPPRDVSAMARAFRMLYADEALRTQLGIAARQRAECEFTWRRYAERAAAKYIDIVGRRENGPCR